MTIHLLQSNGKACCGRVSHDAYGVEKFLSYPKLQCKTCKRIWDTDTAEGIAAAMAVNLPASTIDETRATSEIASAAAPMKQITTSNFPFRRLIERRIARHAINACLASGFAVEVNDGEETALEASTDKKKILDAMFSTDMDRLYIFRTGAERPFGWILFVYGNDGFDVISDHTTNLAETLEATNAWANRIADRMVY